MNRGDELSGIVISNRWKRRSGPFAQTPALAAIGLLWIVGVIAVGPWAFADAELPTDVDHRRRPVTELDLLQLRDMRGLSVSPDGHHVAFQLQQADYDSNDYELAWFVASTSDPASATSVGDGGEPMWRIFDSGVANGDSETRAAVWSPDGMWIAYLVRHDSDVQIWRSAVNGSTQEPITYNNDEVAHFVWSDDGSKIFFTVDNSRTQIQQALREEGERGYLVDERYMPFYSSKPIWPRSAFKPSKLPVWAVDLQTGEERRATDDEATTFEAITAAPTLAKYPNARVIANSFDNGTVAWAEPEQEKRDAFFPPLSLYAAGVAGVENVRRCADPECTGIIESIWLAQNASEVYYLRREGVDYSSLGLYSWSLETDVVRLIKRTDDYLMNCDQASEGLVCFHESALTPRKLVSIDLLTGDMTTLVDPNPEIQLREKGIATKLTWRSSEYDEEGFGHLIRPLDYEQGRHYPLIITTYNSRGFLRGAVGDEYPIQVFAANGFVVLDFDRPSNWALLAAATNADELDQAMREDDRGLKRIKSSLDAAIDLLIDMDLIDPQRIALTGLSLGSEITLYSITRPNRFAVAVASSPSRDPLYYYLGGIQTQERLRSLGYGHPAGKDAERWAKKSVSSNIDAIKTPLLFQASESEYLIALEAFAAMREARKPFELYVFPDEKHIKSQPKHRYHVYRRNVQWLKFWLQGIEDPNPLDPLQYDRWRAMRSEQKVGATRTATTPNK